MRVTRESRSRVEKPALDCNTMLHKQHRDSRIRRTETAKAVCGLLKQAAVCGLLKQKVIRSSKVSGQHRAHV